MNEVQCFYERLYKSRDVEDCEINERISEIPELSKEQQASLEEEITLEEAGTALKNMKMGKVQEQTALVQIFFIFIFYIYMLLGQFGDFVVRALNESYRDGELSATQKQGIIICIPKGDKNFFFFFNGGQFLF